MSTRKAVVLLVGTALIILFSFFAGCSQQGTVRPKQAKAKKCVDCHPEFIEKFTRNILHAPVKNLECESCHQSHGIIGGLFNRYRQPQLCVQCHEGLSVGTSPVSIHEPLQTDKCTLCHDPHESDYEFLLKTAPGKESCFSCHDREPFEKQHVHAPVNDGCNTCHDPHFTGNASLLKMDEDSLCESCHNTGEKSFQQMHFGYPVDKGCVLCHTPHSSEENKLLKKYVHEPMKKGMCAKCHVDEAAALGLRAEPDALCLTCHDTDSVGKKSVHQPFAEDRCTACHTVHASDTEHILSASSEKVCLGCHEMAVAKQSDPVETQKPEKPTEEEAREEAHMPDASANKNTVPVRSVHRPVSQGRCLDCHNGHNSKEVALLKKGEAILCQDCHSPADYTAAGGSHPTGTDGLCSTCHLSHSSANTMLLADTEAKLCFSCHKKTASERGMFDMHTPFARGKCGDCHKLHKPVGDSFLRQENGRSELCNSCHAEISSSVAVRVKHAPVEQGKCTGCHSHHAADFSPVMKQDPGSLCAGCHEAVSTRIKKVSAPHKPAVDGECTTCHEAHGSNRDNIVKEGQPVLCLACHKEITVYWRDGVAHPPAVSDCLQCHNPHGSDIQGMLQDEVGKLCRQCHDVTSEAIMQSHKGIEPKTLSCISCHDSHGSQEKGLLYPVAHTPFKEGTCSPCHPGRAE